MERFVKGEIVVINFPFTDLTSSIKRPALVCANLRGEDLILCEITTKERKEDIDKISLSKDDFESGAIKVNSFIRVSRLFTLRNSLVLYKLGKLKKEKIKQVENKLCEIFTR